MTEKQIINKIKFWEEKNKNAEGEEYKKLCLRQIKLYKQELKEVIE